ncbi:hypothetical protein GO730_20790 [Spirosoma sp. HMF3257]|uniref:Uncharacterized protein n=1 Tax=Spirosoma telluris TaxID=2183553 RepID=A0A327NMP6_9BACT|nr:hypothetical protein [Spirosoma telluris]RAI75985.1 hypothetical protein HMF3257_20710 [Spirosoma telluris]
MTNKRFVHLYTWWITPKGTRQFCLVDKFGKFVDEAAPGSKVSVFKTTQVKLIETLNPNPVNYSIEDFWDLVDRGKLIEYIPNVTTASKG